MSEVLIVDYEMGNLRSVQKALEKVGATARVTQDAAAVARAERLVLPGVGAFGDAMKALKRRGLDEAVKEFLSTGRPFLGICLGLQLLVEEGLENGRYGGLGVLKGRCVGFPANLAGPGGSRLKVPHMGWNSIEIVRPSPLFRGVADGTQVYFVHSYVVEPADESVTAARTEYGTPFASSIWRENMVATQFHPEKSQRVGLRMLENFFKM
jgi:glutamine amidotransferase